MGVTNYFWFTNKKAVKNYVKNAEEQFESNERKKICSALNLVEKALAISPSNEKANELKARCLLRLRRYKDVVTMLQDYLPSFTMSSSSMYDSLTTTYPDELTPSHLSNEGVRVLSSGVDEVVDHDEGEFIRCFSISHLKKKLMAGFGRSSQHEGHWRYLVLGQACSHLGMMEDAMVLLQTGKRLATSAFRRKSFSFSDDSFSSSDQPSPLTVTELEIASNLLTNIKLVLRRKTLAIAALDAGLYSEAIKHFTKIVNGRSRAPQSFLAECFLLRAYAYRSAGRFAEAIADCNRTLALEPSCLEALSSRASLFETVCFFPDSLHDLERLKLLYKKILKDRKLPGPAWKRQNVQYKEIHGKLCLLATKIQELKQKIASGKTTNSVDYHALIGLSRGCTTSELDRTCRLLMLRLNPEKSVAFIEKCAFPDQLEAGCVRDRAIMSSFLLYRQMQNGHTSLTKTIMGRNYTSSPVEASLRPSEKPNSYKSRMFCRDLPVFGSLQSHTGFTHTGFNNNFPLKYALSC